MLTEIFLLIVSYLGVFVGYGLSKIAKEEVKFGKKNIAILHNILFALAIVSFVYISKLSTPYVLAAIISLIIVGLITKNNYAMLGVIFGLEPSFLVSGLIFIYGFPAGSLMYKDDYVEILKKTWPYLALGIISLLVRNYFLI